MIGNLQEIDSKVSRFLQKASKKNEPLEAFRTTDDFKSFEDSMSTGMLDQVKAMAKKLPKWMVEDEAFDDKRVTQWVEDNQKSMAKYVSQKDIYSVLIAAFTYSVESFYQRQGVKLQKAAGPSVTFELTNQYYLDALQDQANYLLNKSSIDETTRTRMINLIRDTRTGMATIDELAEVIVSEFEGISDTRAFMIANTEANQAMSSAQQAFLVENGFKTKVWIPAGPNTCSICQGNADDGPIALNEDFSSGDSHPPGHPGCECYEDAGDEIDLDSIDLWDGGGEVSKATKQEVSDVRAEIKKTEEAIMGKVQKQIEAQSFETAGKIDSVQQTLAEKIKGVQDYMKGHAEEVRKSLAKNGQPINKTVIQKMNLPSELIDILTLLSSIVAQPAAISLNDYKPHDEEEGDIDYYGFLHPSGAWYIMAGEEDQQRYAAGQDGYIQAWKNRTNLKYQHIDEAFA